MNFSSQVERNNRHVPLPSSGTHLNAALRFKLLKDLKLGFGDVNAGEETGTLVVGSYGEEAGEIETICKGVRLYE